MLYSKNKSLLESLLESRAASCFEQLQSISLRPLRLLQQYLLHINLNSDDFLLRDAQT